MSLCLSTKAVFMGLLFPLPEGLKLEIDGQEFALEGIWIHHQRDPYPGGHEYHLRVPTALAKEWIVPPGILKTAQIDECSQHRGLNWFWDLFRPFRMKGPVAFS
jgi:hypothetical protein